LRNEYGTQMTQIHAKNLKDMNDSRYLLAIDKYDYPQETTKHRRCCPNNNVGIYPGVENSSIVYITL